MKTYISILRGINVSGHKLIKMDAIRKSYDQLGFQNITTYVQSGNIVFTSKKTKSDELAQKISEQIEEDYGFEVPVIVMTIDTLRQIIDDNPFLKDTGTERTFLHVTFLSSEPHNYDLRAIEEKKQKAEEIVVANKAVYLYCPNGYGKSKLNNRFLENKLRVGATTRNWKTTNKLLEIAQEIAQKR